MFNSHCRLSTFFDRIIEPVRHSVCELVAGLRGSQIRMNHNGLQLETLEERIVLDGAPDAFDHVTMDGPPAGWFDASTAWAYFEMGDCSCYHQDGDHIFVYESGADQWWWFDPSEQQWEHAYEWFQDNTTMRVLDTEVPGPSVWAYNQLDGTYYYRDVYDGTGVAYQDHATGQWFWYDLGTDQWWNLNGSDWEESAPPDAMNDGPTIDVAAIGAVAEDSGLIDLGAAFTVDDPDSLVLTVSLSGATGFDSLTVGSGTGTATVSQSAALDWTVEGSIDDVNAALDTLNGSLTGDFEGTAVVDISVSDGVTTTADALGLTVTPVQDDPVLVLTSPAPVDEDGNPVDLNDAIRIEDPDVGDTIEVEIEALQGYSALNLTPVPGVVITQISASHVQVSGPLADVNSALATLTGTLIQDFYGTARINVTGSDGRPAANDYGFFDLTVNSQNDAPVLDNTGDMSLDAIDEDIDPSANTGNTVDDIIASAGGDRITDVDTGAVEGIAITGIDNTNGVWQFSTNTGGSWTNISPSTATDNALLLGSTDLVRFLPDTDYHGTVDPGITFRAWDQTSGSAGDYADTSTNGGTSAFSVATETASITVNMVPDQFVLHGTMPGDYRTVCLAIGDLDGDNDLDVVEGANAHYIHLNDGNGNYTQTSQSAGTPWIEDIALGDVDGDNDLDIVFAIYENSGNTVWENDGSGNFTDTGQSLGTYDTTSVVLIDLDDDGDLDIVAGNGTNQGDRVYLNDGSGNFTDYGVAYGSLATYSLAAADIDDDGDFDVVAGNYGSDILTYLNNGTVLGVWQGFTALPVATGDTYTHSIGLADVTGDTVPDLIEGNDGANRVYRGNGDGTFTDTGQTLGNRNSRSIALADLDYDGDIDFVAGNGPLFSVNNRLYLNDGSGNFADSGLGSGATRAVVIGDVNGDGYYDIIYGDYNQSNRIWLND
jgi:hypothetical protein